MLRMVGATTRPAPDGSRWTTTGRATSGCCWTRCRPHAATPLPAEPWRLNRVRLSGRPGRRRARHSRTAQSATPGGQVAERAGDEPGGETLSHARAFVSFTAALMATDISTTTTELPESRVRVEAEVGPGEVERRMTQAAKLLARNIRVPGFRAGKAPPPVVIKRVGREAVLDEAVRESLGSWYRAAIDDAHVVPVGEPDLDIGRAAQGGRAAEVLDRDRRAPEGDARRLQGPRGRQARGGRRRRGDRPRSSTGLRERAAKLETVERQAQRGDFVVMDFAGTLDGVPFAGGEGRDQMIELGSGRLVPGFEEQLEGAVGGEERTVTVTFPDDYGSDGARRPGGGVRRQGPRGQGQAAPGARRRVRRGGRLRHARRAARGHPLADRRGRVVPDRGRVPRGGARRRGRGRDDRGARRADRGARPRDVGLDAALALAPGHQPRDLPADLRALRGGDDRAGQAGRRAGAAPRGRAGRGGRGRVARADRGGDARGRRRGGAARREGLAQEAAGAPEEPTGAWTASRTTWRSARRWTWSRSRPSRFRPPSSQKPDAPHRYHNPGRRTRVWRARARC